ncbi:MAG: carboxypeptidase-like regulatory domain-containing protein, partial [Bacteroidales bacterium]|nr:carboxypeptidase-like regulatory domain-containing protein [Bacteroidales bacterium]
KEVKNNDPYFFTINYMWNGTMLDKSFKIDLNSQYIKIDVIQPSLMYPGQKANIKVIASDVNGNPVPNMDITAFGLTKKFDYKAPNLPCFQERTPQQKLINTFNSEIPAIKKSQRSLDYNHWKKMARLDSLHYYDFLYPKNGLYSYTYIPTDSLTQFSPFVVKNGHLQPVGIIYVDHYPVYFNWNTVAQPYSFPVDSGYHQVRIRTYNKEIWVDSVYFPHHMKTIICVDLDSNNQKVKIIDRKSELSKHEKKILYRWIMPYTNNFKDNYAYVKEYNTIQLLNTPYQKRRGGLAGPINKYSNQLRVLDNYSLEFKHEPQYRYEFKKGLIKMKCVKTGHTYPKYIRYKTPVSNTAQLILTEEKIRKSWNSYVDSKRLNSRHYNNFTHTYTGYGRLRLSYQPKNVTPIPLNTVLFKYNDSQFSEIYPGNMNTLHMLQPGLYKIVFLYGNEAYSVVDSVVIKENGTNYLAVADSIEIKIDDFGREMNNLIKNNLELIRLDAYDQNNALRNIHRSHFGEFRHTPTKRTNIYTHEGPGGLIRGVVVDEQEIPIPGASVFIKGTSTGTLTNLDGYFEIYAPFNNSELTFSYIGCKLKSVQNNGSLLVMMEANNEFIEEVVVIGYGVQKRSYLTGSITNVRAENLIGVMPGVTSHKSIRIRGASSINNDPLVLIDGKEVSYNSINPDNFDNITILKDASATAIYGTRGANGVILISTKGSNSTILPAKLANGATYDLEFMNKSMQSSSIRSNFSDYAFWEPKLTTDENGIAEFEITLPDDITNWNTYYLAMDDKQNTGQTEGTIKSYKPVMAQLAIPRFLVRGDTANTIGKSLNYTSDTIAITTRFEVNDSLANEKEYSCSNAVIDTLTLTALTDDTLSVIYLLSKKDGYFDGEKREIPVYNQGLEETVSKFIVLDTDSSLTLTFDTTLGDVSLYATANSLDILENEANAVINYAYNCNEQMASKLNSLLALQQIHKAKGQVFIRKQQVRRLIHKLNKNKNEHGLWGWWGKSKTNYWISLYIYNTLKIAENLGYENKLCKKNPTDHLIFELTRRHPTTDKIRMLVLLTEYQTSLNLPKHISIIEKDTTLTLDEKLMLWKLKQEMGINYNRDSLFKYQRSTLFGNIYYSVKDTDLEHNPKTIQTTTYAYQLLQADTLNNNEDL